MVLSGNPSNSSSSVDCTEGPKKVLQTTFMKMLVVVVVMAICVSVLGVHALVSARADNAPGNVFASSNTVPLLQFPEGITSWQNKLFVATYNVVTPSNSRIFVFNASSGKLMRTIGGTPGTQLVSSGALLGLAIDPNTGYLYAANNFTGQILQIINPISNNPRVSVYATVPSGGGPEDLVFFRDGTLLSSDSNLGVVYAVPPGGGKVITLIGPPSSGAIISDNGLFASPVAGLSPNGIVFSPDWKTLYVANTWADSVVAFNVNDPEHMGSPHSFAQNVNDDLEEYPTGFDALMQQDTHLGATASTPLNGPDGLAMDSKGNIWVASNLGDNLTVLNTNGNVVTTYGTSAVTQGGLMNQPSGMTFIGNTVYSSNLGIFTGLAGSPNLPFQIVSYNAGVSGAGGNGNY